jgi:hypothetical protein
MGTAFVLCSLTAVMMPTGHKQCAACAVCVQYFLDNMWPAIKRGSKTQLKAGLVFQEIFSYIKARA